MNRRLVIITASILVVLGLVLAAVFLFMGNGRGLVATNPFGGAGDRDPGTLVPVGETGVPIQGAGEIVAPRLLKITDGPVARGAIALYVPPITTTASTTDASSTPQVVTKPAEVEVRYIERQSGNIYSFRIHERTATRISNKTLPGIQEASWLSDGSRAFVRFLEQDSGGLEHVSTYMLPANGEGGYFLEKDLALVRAASTSVVALYSSGSGSVASVAGSGGTGGRTIFSTVLSSLNLAFAGSNFIVTTKASANLDGYAFLVDQAGSFTRLLGPLRGLSTLPNESGSQVLFTYTDRNKLYTQVLDTANRTAVPLPLTTLAEKCVWTSDETTVFCAVPTSIAGTLPDDWYQGARTFTDRIWRIDLASRVATLVIDPKELANETMDMEALTLDVASDVLVFMNRNDGSLWSYDL